MREAQMQKVPYMLVIGGREAEAGQVAVRDRADPVRKTSPLSSLLSPPSLIARTADE